jgi:mitochondrial inner membrane protease subunit 2
MPGLSRLVDGRALWAVSSVSLWAVATSIYFNDNLYSVTSIHGGSMAPTLSPDFHETGKCDLVLWRKWGIASASLDRGDIVLFRSPNRPETEAVKRVIATDGDRVLLDPRRRPQRERDGADLPESRAWDMMKRQGEVVPPGHVWVEGDYWRKTWDSNAYGPISKSLLLGKAVAVVTPSRWWTKPWEGFRSRTKVVPGRLVDGQDEAGLIAAIRNG